MLVRGGSQGRRLRERTSNINFASSILPEWKVCLVECEGRARLLYRGPTAGVQEFMLDSGEFDRALRATWDQLDEWAERELPTDAP